MTTYGPFTPAGWTSADQVCCSTSSFNAVSVQTEGGYIDDTDSSTYSVALRFPVDTTGMVTFTSASLVLTRTPNSYGEGGTNGVISIRLEDTTSSAAYSSGANPYGRTYRTTEVEYDFPNNDNAVTIDLSAIFSDFYGAHSPGSHTLTLMFGAQQRGWTSSSVSYRCVTNQQNTGGVLPSLTIVGSTGGSAVTVTADAGAATGAGTNATLTSVQKVVPTAGAATGSGASAGTNATQKVTPTAGAATGAGATANTTSIQSVATTAGAATGAGSNVTISATSAAVVTADPGAATGSGSTATPKATQLVGATAGAATGAGSTANLTVNVTVVASPGAATGAAQPTTVKSTQAVSATAGAATGAGATAIVQGGSFVPGTQYPSLADYFTHTIPARPRTVMFWGKKSVEYDYLAMTGADYIYSDIVFTGSGSTPPYRLNTPPAGEHGWFKFEKGQGNQYIEIDKDYYGIFCFAVVYRADGTTDVYYARQGAEMTLVGTCDTTQGDATEWWFGMFEGVVRWQGMTEYLYIDNTEWDLTRIRSQSKHRLPTQSIWGFYPLENGSGAAETYGSSMTQHGTPVADSLGVEFPIFVTVTADPGAATGVGGSAGTTAVQTLTATAGAATGSGASTSLRSAQTVSGSPGAATGAGASAGTLSLQIVSATAGAATGAGSVASVSTFALVTVIALPGAATAVGSSAGTIAVQTVAAIAGAATGAGDQTTITNLAHTIVTADPGAATGVAPSATLTASSIVAAEAGSALGLGYSSGAGSAVIVVATPGSALGSAFEASLFANQVTLAGVGTATGLGYIATVIDTGAPTIDRWSVTMSARRWATIRMRAR